MAIAPSSSDLLFRLMVSVKPDGRVFTAWAGTGIIIGAVSGGAAGRGLDVATFGSPSDPDGRAHDVSRRI